MDRLQKVIANAGYTSRRKAEELILEGRVKVNNETVDILGYKVSSKDKIYIDDILLEKDVKVYYLLNKPRGVICSTDDDKNRKIITSLIDTDMKIFPVGRLDYDTTGLIILTNDGELANIITNSKNNIPKVYVAKVKGFITPERLYNLKNGVVIDGVKTKKAKVKIKKYDKKSNTSMVEVTITEGRNHQVKRMFEAIGLEVLKLKREKIAFLTLDGLASKDYRCLTIKEVKQLYSLNKSKKRS